MVNYACDFSQSESGKYFEWIITFNRSLLILRTAVLSLFHLLVIPSNSAELATRELNSWLLVKQILKVGLGAELLLSADEPLSFPTLLEALWLDSASEESPLTGTKSCRIDWLFSRSSSLSLRNWESEESRETLASADCEDEARGGKIRRSLPLTRQRNNSLGHRPRKQPPRICHPPRKENRKRARA